MNSINSVKTLFKAGVFALCIFALPNTAYATDSDETSSDAYAQLSSFTTQTPGVNPQVVTLENVDALSNLKVASHNKVIVKESGTYFIMASGRVGSIGLGLFGNVNMWLIRNGTKLACTCSSQSVVTPPSIYNITSQAVWPLKAGDSISIGISASSSALGLISNKADSKNPAVPSIIFTMFKID